MTAAQTHDAHRAVALRPPQQVMRLSRMGCFHQTRLSFMRALMRSLKRDHWRFERIRWEMDARGAGLALYRAHEGAREYALVCFAQDLPAAKRSDRVIATEWDATFALYDGIPDAAELARLADNVPKQEAGRYRQSELVLARANRSVRVFADVVARLAAGEQPPPALLDRSGYLMRTTAVYGNGKFGLSDRERIASRAEFAAPFRAELLAVWLIRWFSIDLVEHLARAQAPSRAVALERPLARRLGVGNATGLGMAPFLLLHPSLLHRWMHARETALARVRGIERADDDARGVFVEHLARARIDLDNWRTADQRQRARVAALQRDLTRIEQRVAAGALDESSPWDGLIRWSERALSLEGQEYLVTLVLEPHGAWIDDLTEQMASDESRIWRIRGEQRLHALLRAIDDCYGWALATDYAAPAASARFWYVSEEKLEPRLGERADEPGAERELPLAYARDVAALRADAAAHLHADGDASIAAFLRAHPRHRHAVRRVQIAAQLQYAEIRDNLIAAEMLPIDLLRCKLSFFGANQFDPKSDRWVRITMYQHAPLPDELARMDADDWSYAPRG